MLLWGSLCHHVQREASRLHPIYALDQSRAVAGAQPRGRWHSRGALPSAARVAGRGVALMFLVRLDIGTYVRMARRAVNEGMAVPTAPAWLQRAELGG